MGRTRRKDGAGREPPAEAGKTPREWQSLRRGWRPVCVQGGDGIWAWGSMREDRAVHTETFGLYSVGRGNSFRTSAL